MSKYDLEEASQTIQRNVEDRLELCLTAKADKLEEAMTVLMVYAGYRVDVARDFAKSSGEHSTLPKWFEDKTVLNVLQEIVRTAAAIVSANKPTWVVEPLGDDTHKYQAARGVGKLLDYFYRSNDTASLLDDVVLRAALLGTAGIFADWDSQVGRGDIPDSAMHREGWFITEPVDIFNLHIEPGVGGIDRAHWAMRETTLHLEEARFYYNRADIDPHAQTHDGSSTVSRHLRIVADTESANMSLEDQSGRIRVLEYWERPTLDYPDGYRSVVAGDTLVDSGPLLGGEFPVYMMRFSLEPWRDYGGGIGSLLLQLQRDLSMTWNAYRARRDQEVRPPFWAASNAAPKGINSKPGAINPYNPRLGRPEPWQFQPFTQTTGKMAETTIQLMQHIAGINDASRGETPTSNATGRMVAYLAELDNRKLGPTVRSMGRMLSKFGRRLVRLWQSYGSESISVSVVGRGHATEISEVRREDLLWQDISVETASLMPKTQTMRQETILNLFQMGAISREQMLEAMEFGSFDEAMGYKSTEAMNAREENDSLEDLELEEDKIEVLPYEDHETHIREHRRFVLMNQYGPLIRERFDRHLAVHQQHMQPPPEAQPGGKEGLTVAGGQVSPGGLPPPMTSLQEPGVDTGEEEALASAAGIPQG